MPLLAGGSERPWEPVVGTPLWPSSLPHCWQVQANAIFTLAMAIAIAGLNGNDNMVLGNANAKSLLNNWNQYYLFCVGWLGQDSKGSESRAGMGRGRCSLPVQS